LCQKAYEFGMKDSSGYPTAIDAMKLMAQAAPEKKWQAHDKLIEALQARFNKSEKAERQGVGEDMIDLWVARGDDRAAAKMPAEATALYRKASSMASDVGSSRIGEITEKIKQVGSIPQAEARVADLKKKLKENPKSPAARTGLILAYEGEFDSPAEAVKLLADNLDEKLRRCVPLSTKPVADLEEAACLELAGWYAEAAEKASPAGKSVLLGKSKACCQRFLDRHADQDAARLKASMLLGKIAKASEAAGLEIPKYIVLDAGKDVALPLVLVPAGKFMMGNPMNEKNRGYEEGPPHEVAIDNPFYLGVCEVTQAQYEAVMGANPSRVRGARNPVETVSWNDAVEFCKKLSAKTGKTVRLPTEAQWEYACRAGSKTRFAFGDKEAALGEYAWYLANSAQTTHPVGLKKPNAWGLYDMYGNVWEWCSDWYYPNVVNRDPKGDGSGTERAFRGGTQGHPPVVCRSTARGGATPDVRDPGFGFRVAVDAN
ncbi:MAG: formylglycine-generating enzyme family protein, partial [Planctomycetota bacterium]|nr:formylglycine-generating enzyme family protein [Planctomycetota bacterium]